MGNEKEAPGTCPGCLWPGEMSFPALLACCHRHSSCRHRPRLGILSPKHFVLLRKRALCLQRDLYQDFPWMPSAGMRWCSRSAEAAGGQSGGGWGMWPGAEGCGGQRAGGWGIWPVFLAGQIWCFPRCWRLTSRPKPREVLSKVLLTFPISIKP